MDPPKLGPPFPGQPTPPSRSAPQRFAPPPPVGLQRQIGSNRSMPRFASTGQLVGDQSKPQLRWWQRVARSGRFADRRRFSVKRQVPVETVSQSEKSPISFDSPRSVIIIDPVRAGGNGGSRRCFGSLRARIEMIADAPGVTPSMDTPPASASPPHRWRRRSTLPGLASLPNRLLVEFEY